MPQTNAQAALIAAASQYSDVDSTLEIAQTYKDWLDGHDARIRRAAQEAHPQSGAITLPPMPIPGVQD